MNELYHYGMPRRSGRYPYGSGKRPYQSRGTTGNTTKKSSEMTNEELAEYIKRRKLEDTYNKYQQQDEGPSSLDVASETTRMASNLVNTLKNNINESYRIDHQRQKQAQDLSNMPDEDLRKIVNRMNLERQYKDLTPVNISEGEEIVKKVMSGLGTTLAVTASALSIAVSVKRLMG